jgi:hypothetical protein
MRSTLAEFLPGLLCAGLLLGMLAVLLLAVGTARGWGEREWRRAKLAVLLLGLWAVARALGSTSPSLLLGLLILFQAERLVEPGEPPAPWRRKLGIAVAGGVAFLGLALLWRLLSQPSLAPPWKALASIPFLAYGGVTGMLLRQGLRDWRRRRAKASSWKLPPAIVLLGILGLVLAGLWQIASRHIWWLLYLGPGRYVAWLRPSDSLLSGSAWLAMQWLDLVAWVVLPLWLFQHLWERLVLAGVSAVERSDVSR